MQNETSILIGSGNRTVKIASPVKDSLHASIYADRLNSLPYLKVFERKYTEPFAEISAHIIPGIFSIEKLHADMDLMSDLILERNETD
ncbi:MAG: hypothetical protein WCG08_12505 [Paludibacter sp.]|jgi:hypothetical protein